MKHLLYFHTLLIFVEFWTEQKNISLQIIQYPIEVEMKTSHIPYFVNNSQFVNCLWTDKNLSSKKQTFKKNAKYKLKNNLEKKL